MKFNDIQQLWAQEAQSLPWIRRWNKIATAAQGSEIRWFPGGTINASCACLDVHKDTPTWHKPAIIWEDELGNKSTLTYEQLYHEVNSYAMLLQKHDVTQGDIVIIYLPMIPQAIISMLALARLGATHAVVFSGFSAKALAERINDTKARLVITADFGIRRGKWIPLKSIIDEALQETPAVTSVLVIKRTSMPTTLNLDRDIVVNEVLPQTPPSIDPIPVASEHPLFILYTSGTTGKPKGIIHGTGGYLTQVFSTFKWAFAPTQDDIYWCTADIGWITGHSYGVYAPLMHGITLFIYEGAPDAPHPHRWWDMIERYGITIFYTAPTALRMAMQSDQEQLSHYDLSSLRLLGSVGEPINPTVWKWFYTKIGKKRCPIIDTWWQTETGGFMIAPQATTPLDKLRPGSASLPLPGIQANIVDETGKPVAPNTKGRLIIAYPWPGMALGILNDQTRFQQTYWSRFQGKFDTNDYAMIDQDGYFWLLGRADEVINVAGHCIGTAEIEHAALQHPAIAEAAAIGIPDPIKGESILLFVVLKTGNVPSEKLIKEIGNQLRTTVGTFVTPKEVRITKELPKTRSGKIMRRMLRNLAEGKPVGDTSSIENEKYLKKT